MAVEGVDDALGFFAAEEAVVDEDAGELVADRAVDEGGGDGGVDAAGERADDAPVADLLADAEDGVGDEVAGGPVAAAAADAEEEVLEELLAVGRVHDFGVELEADEAAVVRHDGVGGAIGVGEGAEAGRELGDAVAVGHPDGDCRGQAKAVERDRHSGRLPSVIRESVVSRSLVFGPAE